MEVTQELLDKPIGTKESTTVKPAIVKIVKATVEAVGDKGSLKLVLEVKHPDKQETIKISSVKFEKKGKLESSGLWCNLDEDKNVKKGSALATLISFLGCKTIRELEGKECNTIEDDTGYLIFKAY